MDYKDFTAEEFKKCTPSCDISQMDVEFMNLLQKARTRAGIPFILNSAYRSVEYEKRHFRSGLSSHCKGLAVDIKVSTSADCYIILRSLLDVGFTRIGVHKTFIHVDLDPSKFSPCIWTY